MMPGPDRNPPVRTRSMIEMIPIVDLAEERFRRDLERLHCLGARALYQMLDELGARHLLRTEIEEFVRRYSRIDSAKLIAAGGDRWPPR